MSTRSADDLQALVEECEDFSRCPDCGTHVVNLTTHRCPRPGTDAGSPSGRADRRARADRDSRDGDDAVGVFRRARGNTYAYHELDAGEVYCGCGEYTKAGTLDVVSRDEAKALGRSPCGTCERLSALRGED